MTDLLTAAQMRAIEQAAIDSGDVTGLDLMERAGQGVVDAILKEWPELAETTHRAVVLCGPGNNGGDGFVVARLLKERGWDVDVLLYGDPKRLPPDAARNHDLWLTMGKVEPLSVERASEGLRPTILVDAMFGTGLSRPVPLECAKAYRAVEERDVGQRHPWLVPYHTVAIDCPSGLDADSGNFLMPAPPPESDDEGQGWWTWWSEDASLRILQPKLTLTFHRRKLGHYLNAPLSRAPVVVDIGLGRDDRNPAHLKMPQREGIVRLLDFDAPKGSSRRIWPGHDLDKGRGLGRHKFDHGHALILSGGPGKTGAARLAARGALRIGAGLVTLGVPPSAQLECATQLTAIMLTRLRDAEALAATLEDDRINALCIGPGFGTGEREAAILAMALGVQREAPGPRGGRDARPVGAVGRDTDAEHTAPTPTTPRTAPGSDPTPPVEDRAAPSRLPEAAPSPHPPRHVTLRPTVLDADALTILAADPDLFAALHDACILTPHAGEFRRLFPDIADRLDAPATTGPAYSKVDATRDAARRAGCTVLFKGPDTVIADPSGRAAINASVYDRAAPWLATAGSGDVLAGFIAGLLARGLAPFDAASTAAWLHTTCALSFGPGLTAEDLPEELPKVFRDLGL